MLQFVSRMKDFLGLSSFPQKSFKFYYFLSFFLALQLSVIVSYWKFARGQGLNFSVLYFFLSFFLTLWKPRYAFFFLIFFLPISSGLHNQVESIFSIRVGTFQHPGLDFSLGFMAAYVLKSFKELGSSSFWKQTPDILYIAHSYLMLSSLCAVAKNLWQSSSVFSVRGLVFNLMRIRYLNWQEDYFPLKDLYSFSVAFCIFVLALHYLRKHDEKISDFVNIPLLVSSLVLASFAILQYCFGFGYVKSGLERGVNSFLPDLHAFAGFMLIPAILPYFILRSDENRRWMKNLCYSSFVLSALAIFLSHSRASSLILIVFWLSILLKQLKLRPRTVLLTSIASVVSGLLFYKFGMRDFNTNLIKFLAVPSFATLNVMSSYRLEIFSASLRMFAMYPLFGIGLGEFNKSGAFLEFSRSDFLVSRGGENAHNYFLQILVDLGLCGFILLALVFVIPLIRRKKWPRFSSSIIFAIFLGNLYSHSLLEREFLVFLGVALAFLYLESGWQRTELSFVQWKQWRLAAVCLVSLFICSNTLSLSSVPFLYGLTCHKRGYHKQFKDGWLSGQYFELVPKDAKILTMVLDPAHFDIEKRPLTVEISLLEGEQKKQLFSRTYDKRLEDAISIVLPERAEGSKSKILIESSHCFVPKNFGTNDDPRKLGVNVQGMEFRL